MREYPSQTTWFEGRWFNDIIYQASGIGGVQAFQMAVGAGIQIINGFLFASLTVTNRLDIFLIAAFIALYPAVLDYYAFTSDHIFFTFGDTLALLGVLALDRIADRRIGVAVAALCFLLCLATYPPKLALIGVLLLIWCIQGALAAGNDLRLLLIDRLVPAAAAGLAGLFAYYISSKLVVIAAGQERTHINDVRGVLRQLAIAYPEIFRQFTQAMYLPRVLIMLPAVGIALGFAALVWQASQRAWGAVLAVVLLAMLFPWASRLSYIVNDQTWVDTGRILMPQAYCFLFFLVSAWAVPRLREISTVLVVVLLYFFVINDSQEANAGAMKTIYDVQKLNRLVARVETVVPDFGTTRLPVVVIGGLDFPSRNRSRIKSYDGKPYIWHGASETFAPYRQVDLLNFFLGHDYVKRPSKAQIDAALASVQGHRPWPAPESVYLQDGVLVMLLQPYGPDSPVTWSR